jgi:hypothetical protein
MQRRAANRNPAAVARKSSFSRQSLANKTNAPERLRVGERHANPKALQRCAPIRQQTFATSFVDGWLRTVRH